MWEFILKNHLPYCKLYDEGYRRFGCIGCPMNSKKKKELERYPTFKRAYLRAFEKMLQERTKNEMKTMWKNANEVMEWWLSK